MTQEAGVNQQAIRTQEGMMIDVFLIEYEDSGVSFTPWRAMWPRRDASPIIGHVESPWKSRSVGRCTDSIYGRYFARYDTAAYVDGPKF